MPDSATPPYRRHRRRDTSLRSALRRLEEALGAAASLLRRWWGGTVGRLDARGRWWALTGTSALFFLGAGVAWGTWTHLCNDCPSIAQIYAFEPKEATRLYAVDGSVLAELAVERRTPISLATLPPHVYQPFIAVEDRRFWSHDGIDPRRTVRAFLDFVLQGYGVAGGSTITQQLAGNMFTASVDRQEISVRRKLREMQVAFALERAYSKREILEAYLNQINFDGVYGVQAAAIHYFGKESAELNLPEAALLAALPKAPARYSPVRHPERAVQRRNLILDLMADQDMVSRQEAEAAKAFPLELRGGGREATAAPYFVEWVRQTLYRRYGSDIYEKGLRVYTTLDPALQAVADSAVQAQLEWVERQGGFRAPTYEETREWPAESLAGVQMPYLQGAFIALDPRTGDVLALVGGRDFRDSEFNRVVQAYRQPGSVFKPFVYTAAIQAGIPASEVIFDTPVEIVQAGSPVYSPRNFDGQFHGPMTLREALMRSINVVAVKLGQRVGVESLAQIASRMGISSPVPRVPSAPIGAASLTPLEIARAFTGFANLGARVEPRAIYRIEDSDGRVLWESRADRETVLDERSAWIVVSMLRDVVDRPGGTGYGAIRVRGGVPADVPVAGKTGTTNDATDTWFVGFTPELLTTTWVGFDRPARIRTGAQGGQDAAPVNAAVIRWFYRDREPPPAWDRPAGLVEREVDRTTGLAASTWCPVDLVYEESYLPGTEPAETCDVHGPWHLREDADSLEAPLTEDFDW